jgi:hypothetical protein
MQYYATNMKRIKLHIVTELELPDNAEVIRFTDEEKITTDHVKIAGRLLRPDVVWLEYTPSKMKLDQKNWHPDMSFGWGSGTELCEKLGDCTEFPKWYMEEAK